MFVSKSLPEFYFIWKQYFRTCSQKYDHTKSYTEARTTYDSKSLGITDQRTDQEHAEGRETKEEHAEKNPSIKTEG